MELGTWTNCKHVEAQGFRAFIGSIWFLLEEGVHDWLSQKTETSRQ